MLDLWLECVRTVRLHALVAHLVTRTLWRMLRMHRILHKVLVTYQRDGDGLKDLVAKVINELHHFRIVCHVQTLFQNTSYAGVSCLGSVRFPESRIVLIHNKTDCCILDTPHASDLDA